MAFAPPHFGRFPFQLSTWSLCFAMTLAASAITSFAVAQPLLEPGRDRPADSGDARPSFDCHQAGNHAERTVCNSPELARLDAELAAAYHGRLAGLTSNDAGRERRRQATWIVERNACRSQITCQKRSYERRLAEIRGAAPSHIPETARVSDLQHGLASVGAGSALKDYPDDFASLQIVHWRGRPVVNHPSSRSGRALFQLLAYAQQPRLITGITETPTQSWLDLPPSSENALELANTFLPTAAKPEFLKVPPGSTTTNAGWLGATEFDTERARRRFIEAYGEKLKDAAPKLPFEFVLISEQWLPAYDKVNSGFAISDSPIPSLGRQVFGWLTPQLEAQTPPIRLWPIARDAADRQLAQLARAARGPSEGRRVVLLKTMEAVAVDPATLGLTLRVKATEIYDRALQRRLHIFSSKAETPIGAQGGLDRLQAAPAGIQPLQLRSFAGLPLFSAGSSGQASGDTARFFSLVAIGAIPNHLEEHAASVADMHLRGTRSFTPGEYRRETSLSSRWPGKDEFERRDSRKAFIDQHGDALRRWAARAPFQFAYTQAISIPDYDQTRNGFRLPPFRVQGLDVSGLQTWESFAWPEPFLPLSQAGARKLLQDLRDAVPRDARGQAQIGERTASLVYTLELAEIDPRSGRAELRLRSLSLYDSQLRAKLLDIFTYDSAGPAKAPGRLPGPVALDSLFVGLQFLKKAPPDGTDPFWAGLGQLVQDRNAKLRNNPAVWGRLPAGDPRRPYFGLLGAQMREHDRAQFRDWAKAFANALPQDVVASFQTNITPAGRDPEARKPQPIAAIQFPRTLNTAFDERALDSLGLQRDQIAVWEIGGRLAFIALPNRLSLYTIDVPAAARDPQGYKAAEVRVNYQVERVDDGPRINGRSSLLIRLVPRNAEVRAPGQQFALRSFDDVPRLEGASFTASTTTPPPAARSSAPLPLDANSFDLLIAAALGERLSPGVMAQLIGRRWVAEDAGGVLPGSRFFTRGKRMPTLEEAAELAPRFAAWAKAAAPAFPARLTRAVPVTLRSGQQALSWGVLNCFQGLPQDDAFWAAGLERANAARMAHRSSWTLAEERAHLTSTAASRLKDFMAPLAGSCLASRQPYTVPQLFGTYVSFAGMLPVPTPRVGPSGQQQLSLAVTVEVDAPRLQQSEPIFTDLLPQDITAPDGLRQNRRKGEFALFQSRLIEASFSDQAGREPARFTREGPVTVASILQSLRDSLAKVVPPSEAGKPYGPDIVGIRLGMSFAEAEAAIRAHMPVGLVLEGKRASDEAASAGVNEPITSGKLYISANGMELIALIDEPPAAAQRVLAAWRRVHSPTGQIKAPEMYAGLQGKYGPLPDLQQFSGVRALWYDRATAHCTSIYRYGQRRPLAAFWYEEGAPTQWTAPGGRPADAAILPTHFQDPLSQESQRLAACGPMLTAELIIDTTVSGSTYYRHEQIDLLEMSLSDFGAYRKAFVESRRQLQAAAQGGGSRKGEFAEPFGPDMVGLRLGQSLQEAEATIRAHMDVGRIFEAHASAAAGRPPVPFASGKIFLSRDEREMIAIHPGPAADGRLVAAWRRIYAPATTALDTAAGPMQAKYGEPAFRSLGGDVVVWGPTRLAACNDAYVAAVEATQVLAERWRENDSPVQWRPPNGEAPARIPGLLGSTANGEPWLENCGPRMTLQFRPAQGEPALAVIETTLTDLGRYRRVLEADRPAVLPGRVKL